MGERFRREVLAHGGEIPPKDLIKGKQKDCISNFMSQFIRVPVIL